jgi:hypothetical protein
MPRFHEELMESITIVTRDEQRFDDVPAHVTSKGITVWDVSRQIEPRDRIFRQLSTIGTEGFEEYTVVKSTFRRAFGSFDAHWFLEVSQKGAIRDEIPVHAVTQNIGTLIQGGMSGGNLLSVGVSSGDVSQIINDRSRLTQEIDGLVEKLLEVVKPELNSEDLFNYMQAAREMRQELMTETPQILLKSRGWLARCRYWTLPMEVWN